MGPTKFAVLIGLGLLFVIGGLVGFFVIRAQVKAAILDTMVVDSKDHKDFEDWADPFGVDDSASLRKIFLFNLTNPEMFRAGLATPNFEEIGPFVYRYYERKFNVNFTDDGSRVSYDAQNIYVYQPQLSAYPTDKDLRIINVNIFYVGLINTVDGEANLPFVLATGIFSIFASNSILAQLWGTSLTGACLPGLPNVCGIAMFNNGSIPMTPTQSAAIVRTLSNPTNLVVLSNVIPVLANPASSIAARNNAMLQLSFTRANSTWEGLPLETYGPALFAYVTSVATSAFAVANAQFGGRYGFLFREASPFDWIFTPDPLLNFLGSRFSLYFNNSLDSYTLRTGKDDEHYAGMNYYEKNENVTIVTAYQEPYPSAGRTRSIPPFGGVPPDRLSVYFSPAQRFLTAVYSAVEEVKGIETAVYVFEGEKLVKADPFFKTAVDGMVDLRPVLGVVPMYLSVPHMWYVPSKYTSLLTGMKQDKKYDSRLWIEEYTGIAIRGERQLQVNVLLNFTVYNYSGLRPQAPEMFVPIFYDIETAEVSDASARSLRRAVVDAAIAQKAILGVLVGVGIALILVGATLMVQLSGTDRKEADLDNDGARGGHQKSQNQQQNAVDSVGPRKSAAGAGSGVSEVPHDDGLFAAPGVVADTHEMSPVGPMA